MIENRAEQREALETLAGFNVRLIKNMKLIVKELTGERKEDTDAFLKDIVQALNWEIQVVNGTMDLLNEDKIRIEKETFNGKIIALSEALAAGNDAETAEKFMEVIPVFEVLEEAVEEVLGKDGSDKGEGDK